MNPKNRSTLNMLENWVSGSRSSLKCMEIDLRSARKYLPAEFAEVHTAIVACLENIQTLWERVEATYDADEVLAAQSSKTPLAEAEISQLLALNRHLMEITRQLSLVADEIRPRMEAKVADPNDPMYDYEIEARLDFVLREDDPDYDENGDNYLTTRTKCLKYPYLHRDERRELSFGESSIQEGLLSDPHCWLFHELYDHAYGHACPKLSFGDCLRIGKVFVDVQVWQQYSFDV